MLTRVLIDVGVGFDPSNRMRKYCYLKWDSNKRCQKFRELGYCPHIKSGFRLLQVVFIGVEVKFIAYVISLYEDWNHTRGTCSPPCHRPCLQHK